MKTIEQLFDYNTKQGELTSICKNIKDTYNKEHGYSSIPKEYYPFLYKLLTYRKFDDRSKYKENEIRTFFVGKDDYGNNSIMFYDINGHCDCVGTTNAIKQWQNEKDIEWEHMKGKVIGVLRNLAGIRVDEKSKTIKLPAKDEISGEMLYDFKDIHIDHFDDDFSKVAYNWIYAIKQSMQKQFKEQIDIIKVLYDLCDNNYKYFKDKKWNRSFIDYHDSHTHLRITSKQNNLKREKYRPNWEFLKINGYYLEKYANEKKLN